METNALVTAGSGGSRSLPLGSSLVLSCSCLLGSSHPVWVAREAPPARQPARSTALGPHSVCFWTFPLSPSSSACWAAVCRDERQPLGTQWWSWGRMPSVLCPTVLVLCCSSGGQGGLPLPPVVFPLCSFQSGERMGWELSEEREGRSRHLCAKLCIR